MLLKIGEFSKLSHLTVKALRFYEKEDILIPAHTDEWTGYRYYETEQLMTAAMIRMLRGLDVSIEEIREILNGGDSRKILKNKARELSIIKSDIDTKLSAIKSILEDSEMKYQVTEKTIPEKIVYSCEKTLENYSDIMSWIPSVGAECVALNPTLKCAEPPYEYLEYLDCEYKERDIRVRHNEAVTAIGKENENIKFRTVPETKVLSVYHKGSYESIPEAYAFIYKYAEENGYKIAGYSRECYIDGIWNKESPSEWLTEVQLPIE